MNKTTQMVLVLLALFMQGCITFTTESTEVGVHVNKITGLDGEVYPGGGTYFFAPFITDWYTFSTQSQTLTMTADPRSGDRNGRDDLEFKTMDGNDVEVDVTLIYHIIPSKAATILMKVARSDEDLKERILRPMCRSFVRDALNELISEDIYAGKKFSSADTAQKVLNKALLAYGVQVDNVILGDHRFNNNYQEAINNKKIFDQQVNTFRSRAESVRRNWEAELEKSKGKVEQIIAQEKGRSAQIELEADAYYVQKSNEADATLSEMKAVAEGITEMNKALSGSGGRTMVKRRVAQSLKGKKIVVLPGGSGGEIAVQKLDVNELMNAYTAQEAAAKPAPKTP